MHFLHFCCCCFEGNVPTLLIGQKPLDQCEIATHWRDFFQDKSDPNQTKPNLLTYYPWQLMVSLSREIIHLIWFGLNEGHSCLGIRKLFNVSLSRIGREASDQWVMLKHFPQSTCILNSHWSLEKKQSSIIIYGRRYLVWLKWIIFITFFQTIAGVLVNSSRFIIRTDQFVN